MEKLGSSVPVDKVNIGEIRWAFIKGSVSKDKGAFAEYVTTEWDLSGVVPDNVTPEEAAGIPIPFATAVRFYQPYIWRDVLIRCIGASYVPPSWLARLPCKGGRGKMDVGLERGAPE